MSFPPDQDTSRHADRDEEELYEGNTGRIYEREFVLMPLFRRIRERLFGRRIEAAEFDSNSLPPDTQIFYPEQLYPSRGEYRNESRAAEATPQDRLMEASTGSAASAGSSEASEIVDTAVVAQDHARQTSLRPGEPLGELLQQEPTFTREDRSEDGVEQPATAAASADDETPLASAALPICVDAQSEAPGDAMAREADASDDILPAAASASARYEVPEEHESVSAAAPVAAPHTQRESVKPSRRQVTFTIPTFRMPSIEWSVIAPALGYGALGFVTCLLLFLIPAVRRPASSLLPDSMQGAKAAPESSQQQTAPPAQPASGYTVNGHGYTVNSAAAPSSVPAVERQPEKPSAAARRTTRAGVNTDRRSTRRDRPSTASEADEQEVVIHHYDTPKPRMLRATSSGVPKISDID